MTRNNYAPAGVSGPVQAAQYLVPVPAGAAAGRPASNDDAGGQWLRAVADMAGLTGGSRPPSPTAGPLARTSPALIATRTLPVDARAVRAGREFAIAVLHRWGATARREDIAIVVSELLTNALRHAAPGLSRGRPNWPIRLGLAWSGPGLLCAVADPSASVPVPKKPGHLAETGRGLQVISSLSDSWGHTTYAAPGGIGKVVWAAFTT